MTAKETFKEVWKEHFGEDINDQLNIALEHDYIFEAMDKYSSQLESRVEPATCGLCRDCEYWLPINEGHPVSQCKNRGTITYKQAIYVDDADCFGCINFSKLSV